MDCPWRRTLASVFLLLSQHNLRVLSQNVRQTGPFPPLPLLNEPWIDYGGPGPGQVPQQINSLPGPPNGILPDFVPLDPFAQEHQRIPENIGPGYPQPLPFSPVLQANARQFPQGPLFNPQMNYLPSLQGAVYNGPQNTIVPPPHGPPLNVFPTPLVPVPLGPSFFANSSPVQGDLPNNLPTSAPMPGGLAFNIPPTNILPTPPVLIPQDPAFNVPSPTNFFDQQGLPSNIPPHLVPVSQGQILPGPPASITPITGPAYNVPPVTGLPNQNTQGYPLMTSSYPQPYYPPANAPCTLTADLSSVHFLPPSNLPSSIPTQNYAPIPLPTQSEVYPQSITPVKYLPNYSPVYSNDHISALPPVFPADIPQLYENSCGNSQSVAEEYSPVPINLNINVSSPTTPESKITIITAYPPAPPPPVVPVCSTDSSDVSLEMFPPYPLPPIIIEGRRSRSKSWLPLFLVALFARDGFHGSGGCGCCCCCSCNSGCADIPVPYPIAIPTNNPIILGCSHRSRKRARGSDKKNE